MTLLSLSKFHAARMFKMALAPAGQYHEKGSRPESRKVTSQTKLSTSLNFRPLAGEKGGAREEADGRGERARRPGEEMAERTQTARLDGEENSA